MKSKTGWARLAWAAALLGLAGCSPLRQASMVYGSKSVGGISMGVSASSPPDFNFTVGFNNNDFAYVPVVAAFELDHVVRACGDVRGDNIAICKSAADQMMRVIVGVYRDSDDAAAGRRDDELQVIKGFEEAAKRASAAKLEAERAAEEAARLERHRSQARSLAGQLVGASTPAQARDGLAVLESLNPPAAKGLKDAVEAAAVQAPGGWAVPPAPVASLAAALGAAASAADVEAAHKRAQDARKASSDRDLELRQAGSQLADAVKRDPALLRTSTGKTDALSVFGRFDAVGTGRNNLPATGGQQAGPSVEANFGKVFSTGVASQNLTEGIKLSQVQAARAECVKAVSAAFQALAPEEKKADRLGALLESCGKPGAAAAR